MRSMRRRASCAVKKLTPESHDAVMHRVMMLRFRPIAPKPAADEAVSTANETIGATRRKRKYVRVPARKRRNTRTSETGKTSPPGKSRVEGSESPPEKESVLLKLQLMLDRSDSERDKSSGRTTVVANNIHDESDRIIDANEVINLEANTAADAVVSASTARFRSAVKTWVIVECVTAAFIDDSSGLGLGRSDWEKINCLSADTCPAFVSDGSHNVVWVNEAYRKMLGEGNGIMVGLLVKEELPKYSPAFACRIRMRQQTREGYNWNTTLACDVWRMESAAGGGGGFAWKLDINTALTLGI